MGREPRCVPANSLQHVTDETFQGRFLLRPSEEVMVAVRMPSKVLGTLSPRGRPE